MKSTNFPICRLVPGSFPAIEVAGRRMPAIAYTSYLTEGRYYAEVAAQGIHLYSFPAYLGDRGINIGSGLGPFRKGLWTSDGEFDFDDLDKDFRMLLAADAEACAIMRLHLDVPTWWEARYPEECCQLADGTTLRQSFFSSKWIADAEAALVRIIEWLGESPYAPHLAGIHVAAGGTEEWVYHRNGDFVDGNPERRTAFRQWLAARYDDDRALREAWGDNGVSLAQAEILDINQTAQEEDWRNPAAERPVIDCLRFHAENLAERIAGFCRVVKRESDGHLLAGAFYGYLFPSFDPRNGHGALHRLLACPDLDYLASPNLYERKAGLDWPPPAPTASVRWHGKVWMAENDTRTCCTTLLKDVAPTICPPGQYKSAVWRGPASVELSRTFLRNNAARMLGYGYGGWWFDMWGGWFSHPDLLAELGLCQDLARRQMELPALLPAAEVALVIDEELPMLDTGYGCNVCQLAECRKALARAGAPYELILRQDLAEMVGEFRLLWLVGLGELSLAEEAGIGCLLAAGGIALTTDRETRQTELIGPEGRQPAGAHEAWTPDQLAELYHRAGVHLYAAPGDIVYAGGRILALHAVEAGSKEISLPFPCRVSNALANECLTERAATFKVEMAKFQTAIFQLDCD